MDLGFGALVVHSLLPLVLLFVHQVSGRLVWAESRVGTAASTMSQPAIRGLDLQEIQSSHSNQSVEVEPLSTNVGYGVVPADAT